MEERNLAFEVGAARVDITVWEPQMGLLGWAVPHNVATGVATPLYARAVVVSGRDGGAKVAYVCCELGFITELVRGRVIERLMRDHAGLGFGHENVMLTAQHTHSGPGGMSGNVCYNMSTPGYSPLVTEVVVEGVVAAIVKADVARVPASAGVTTGQVDAAAQVAFNRSLKPYMANPENAALSGAQETLETRVRATDRTMTHLAFFDEAGRTIAAVNWFATHCTSVHGENTRLHFDNKGHAAEFLEAALSREAGRDVVCIFAQGAAGDVTPNFRWSKARRVTIGASDDDYESARFAGRAQFRMALKLHASLDPRGKGVARELAGAGGDESRGVASDLAYGVGGGVVDGALLFHEIAGFAPDADLLEPYQDEEAARRFGRMPKRTGAAIFGVAMMEGTREGPGPLGYTLFVNRAATRLVRNAMKFTDRMGLARGDGDSALTNFRQGSKFMFFPTGHGKKGRTFYVFNQYDPIVPDSWDTTVACVRAMHRRGGLPDGSWVEHEMPVQIVRFGPLAIVALPNEPTTTAGRRLAAVARAALAGAGVTHVVVNGYANSYTGYVTTPEEYAFQNYEGGHTLFGPATLPAYMTIVRRVAARLLVARGLRGAEIGPVPVLPSVEELERRRYPLGFDRSKL